MPIRKHAPWAKLAIVFSAALFAAAPAWAEQPVREDLIAACTRHQLSIGDLNREDMLEKVSYIDWQSAKDACLKSFVPGEIGWREAYTFAQALVAESFAGSASGETEEYNGQLFASAVGYLSPSLIQDNAEPYLFNAYLSLHHREAFIRELAKAPENRKMKVEANIRQGIWVNGRTAERFLLMSTCFGSPKAFEVLGDFYVRNALDGTMLPNQQQEFGYPQFAPLLKRARDEDNGVAAELLGSQFLTLGMMSRETPASIAERQDDWRIAAAWHWIALSYFARAHGWERLAHERAEAGSRESERSEVIAEMARLDAEKYARDTCGPFLRAQDLSAVMKMEFQPRPDE